MFNKHPVLHGFLGTHFHKKVTQGVHKRVVYMGFWHMVKALTIVWFYTGLGIVNFGSF